MKIDRPDLRVLVRAPFGRDAPATAEIQRRAGARLTISRDLRALLSELHEGAGAVFLAEEGLFGQDITPLTQWVNAQPPWSDLPFILLTSHHEEPAVLAWRQRLSAALRNASMLERPVQQITLTTTIGAALRARARQYEVRALLVERD